MLPPHLLGVTVYIQHHNTLQVVPNNPSKLYGTNQAEQNVSDMYLNFCKLLLSSPEDESSLLLKHCLVCFICSDYGKIQIG
jgi:hypothetical protein